MSDLSPVLLEFLAQPNVAIFTTLRKNGTPHQTAVWYEYTDGEVLVSITDGRLKYRQVKNDPRVSLAVASQSVPYVQVIFEGTATIEDAGGPELFRRLAVRYYGEKDGHAYADYDRDKTDDTRVVLRLAPTKVRSWDFAVVDDYHRPWADGSVGAHRRS